MILLLFRDLDICRKSALKPLWQVMKIPAQMKAVPKRTLSCPDHIV